MVHLITIFDYDGGSRIMEEQRKNDLSGFRNKNISI